MPPNCLLGHKRFVSLSSSLLRALSSRFRFALRGFFSNWASQLDWAFSTATLEAAYRRCAFMALRLVTLSFGRKLLRFLLGLEGVFRVLVLTVDRSTDLPYTASPLRSRLFR